MRNGITFLLLIAMVLVYAAANFLPSVIIDVDTNFWKNPNVPHGMIELEGYACTLFSPCGWLAFLVFVIGIIIFAQNHYKNRSIKCYWILLPASSLAYAFYESFAISQRDPRNVLLIGHYLWLASLLIAIAFYWRLCGSRKPESAP